MLLPWYIPKTKMGDSPNGGEGAAAAEAEDAVDDALGEVGNLAAPGASLAAPPE
jgi:hypothetical protein